MKKLSHIAVAAFVVLSALGGADSLRGARAQSGCLSLDQARALVDTGSALPFSQLVGQHPQLARAEIVSVQLCGGGNGYHYLVSLLEGGTVRTVTIDAGGRGS